MQYSWLIPKRLAVGERPATLESMPALGFSAVLSLQEEDEPGPEGSPPAGLLWARIPIRDGLVGGVPSLGDIGTAVDLLRGFQDQGRATYVHCYAGIGRSPTICMAYLGASEGLTFQESYMRVRRAHGRAEPTPGQLAALAMYLDGLRVR